MGGEIVTFWIGQCGVQLGNACWELYSLEHGISPDGMYYESSSNNDTSFEKFFLEIGNLHFVPRGLLIDLEPTVIDEIKLGKYRKLFHPDSLINSTEDAANNFARGFYSCGREIIKSVVQRTRKTAENCDNIQAFMIHHSFGGGTGSGFSSMLLEYLAVEFSKDMKIEYGIFPSPTLSVSVVEPYNSVLALHTPMENSDLSAFFENESVYKICQKNLEVENISYTIINRLIAQVISGTTASLRFEGPINASMIDFQTNLVPYPRIHFPLLSFYPLVGVNKIGRDMMSTRDITDEVFLKDNQMSHVNPMEGSYMSCCLLYRGNINILDVNLAISNLKKTWSMPWVDWCPTGYKVGINYQPMVIVPGSGIGYSPRAMSLLCNTTSFRTVINRINKKFVSLYERKAFIHWYVVEGLEESEFNEALEDVLMLEKDYEMIEKSVDALAMGTHLGSITKSVTTFPETAASTTAATIKTTEESTDDTSDSKPLITSSSANSSNIKLIFNENLNNPREISLLKLDNESYQNEKSLDISDQINLTNYHEKIQPLQKERVIKSSKYFIQNNKARITNELYNTFESSSKIQLAQNNSCKISLGGDQDNLISIEINVDD